MFDGFHNDLFLQALGMKVVNIVPVGMVEVAKTRMISALDWSLQRWNEEGKVTEEEEGRNDVSAIIERTGRRKRVLDAVEEEEEEEDENDDEEDDEIADVEENPVHDLGESEEEEEEEEEELIEEVSEEDPEVIVQAMDGVLFGLMEDAEEEAINYKTSMAMAKDLSPSPSPQRSVEGGERDEGHVEPSNVEDVVCAQPEHSSRLPVGSFSSGIPSTPGRGFVQFDTSRLSEEEPDVQPMEELDEDERPQSAEDPELIGTRSASKPSARNKMKASRKGRSKLGPSGGGEHSRSSDAMENSGLDREVESGQVADVADQLVDVIMSEAAHDDIASADLNVSSPVEEVAAAVLEVFGQGRGQRDSPGAVVAEEPTVSEAEVIMRKQVICLDSDDDMPDKVEELDVRVKVRDRVPHRVRGTFADYMTDDSEDEDYGMPGYNRVKLSFVEHPHPVLASVPALQENKWFL